MAGERRKMSPGSLSKERFERLQKLNPLFAQGGYTLTELATRFGVSAPTIMADRDYIMEKWWRDEECEKTRDKRLQRVKELEQIKRLSLESYHRSRQDNTETTTRYEKRVCAECGGTGRLPKCTCLNCEGLGHTDEEIVTTKVSGSPGDAAFLNVAKNCVIEICKLEALAKQPQLKVQHVLSGRVEHAHGLDDEKYAHVNPDLVVDAKAAIARLEEAARAPALEGTVVHTESVE